MSLLNKLRSKYRKNPSFRLFFERFYSLLRFLSYGYFAIIALVYIIAIFVYVAALPVEKQTFFNTLLIASASVIIMPIILHYLKEKKDARNLLWSENKEFYLHTLKLILQMQGSTYEEYLQLKNVFRAYISKNYVQFCIAFPRNIWPAIKEFMNCEESNPEKWDDESELRDLSIRVCLRYIRSIAGHMDLRIVGKEELNSLFTCFDKSLMKEEGAKKQSSKLKTSNDKKTNKD